MAIHRYKADESNSVDEPTKKAKSPIKKDPDALVQKNNKKKVIKEKKTKKPVKALAPFYAIGAYFKGSWHELKQVRWPDRKQTWVLTIAVLVFSLVLGTLIFLLDAGFTLLFKKFIF